MVQSSIPIPASSVKSDGVLSSKNAGLATWRGAQTPLYSGLEILGMVHLPCSRCQLSPEPESRKRDLKVTLLPVGGQDQASPCSPGS
jgi:hypothetical protein